MGRIMQRCVLVGLVVLGARTPRGASELLEGLTRLQPYRAQRESSSHPDLTRNGDARSIEPGQTLVLGELDGPGVIAHMWCTLYSDDPFCGRSLVLRMYWDGAEQPSVQAPLGDFFAVGHGAQAGVDSAPVSVTSHGRARTCFWRMPFRDSAKVTVTNESEEFPCDSFYYYLDWQKHESLPEDTAYFHAQYRQETPAQPGNYTILEATGRGHYVGTVYSVQQVETGWFGEGDDFFYIDGEEMPSLRGTGTEDYFCDAWGFRPFCRPYYGVPLYEGVLAGDCLTAYRWHLQDPIPFTKSLKATIEHRGSIFTEQAVELGGFVERPDWVSSVAFWYQYPPATLDETLPPALARVAPYHLLWAKDLEHRAEPAFLLLEQDHGVLYGPSKPDAFIEFDFEVAEAGRYKVLAQTYQSLMNGVYQPMLDGEAFGAPLDMCIINADAIWVNLDYHDLEAGKHTLRFEGRGLSPKMRTMAKRLYGFGLNALVLQRLEDMAGYGEKLKELRQKKSEPSGQESE